MEVVQVLVNILHYIQHSPLFFSFMYTPTIVLFALEPVRSGKALKEIEFPVNSGVMFYSHDMPYEFNYLQRYLHIPSIVLTTCLFSI